MDSCDVEKAKEYLCLGFDYFQKINYKFKVF